MTLAKKQPFTCLLHQETAMAYRLVQPSSMTSGVEGFHKIRASGKGKQGTPK